jgi:two-component system, cell cycle sensor histidine kinase and response regulator CckA
MRETEQFERNGMAAQSSEPRETILVVDDEPDVLSMASDILLATGYKVLSTGDPREALKLASSNAEPIHLLLTDIVMPLMNGGELAKQLRAIRPDVKVLFMSAYSTQYVEDYGVRLGPGELFLVKPFDMAELQSKVKAVLAYRSPFQRPRGSR